MKYILINDPYDDEYARDEVWVIMADGGVAIGEWIEDKYVIDYYQTRINVMDKELLDAPMAGKLYIDDSEFKGVDDAVARMVGWLVMGYEAKKEDAVRMPEVDYDSIRLWLLQQPEYEEGRPDVTAITDMLPKDIPYLIRQRSKAFIELAFIKGMHSVDNSND